MSWEIQICDPFSNKIVHHSKGLVVGDLGFAMDMAETFCRIKNVPFTKHNVFIFEMG